MALVAYVKARIGALTRAAIYMNARCVDLVIAALVSARIVIAASIPVNDYELI